jgi:LAS superfamily LD-carboxypeptidase LdcB
LAPISSKADGVDISYLMPAGPKSAYRDDKTQKKMFDKKVAEVMKANSQLTKAQAEEVADDSVARPGGPHRTGRAIDFKLTDGVSLTVSSASKLKKTEAYQWLAQNAADYGFYNYKPEPWHWEYNPPAR